MMRPKIARFIESQLREVRRFYCDADKAYFQDRRRLIKAIVWPVKWMNERGVRAPASLYARILGNVISTINLHGNLGEIDRFSVYFLHSVQEHMKHHGDQYYYEAKAARPISDIVPRVIRQVRPGCVPDSATETFRQLNRVLRSPGGRRRRIQSNQPDLLASLPPSRGDK